MRCTNNVWLTGPKDGGRKRWCREHVPAGGTTWFLHHHGSTKNDLPKKKSATKKGKSVRAPRAAAAPAKTKQRVQRPTTAQAGAAGAARASDASPPGAWCYRLA